MNKEKFLNNKEKRNKERKKSFGIKIEKGNNETKKSLE
jgi:hypothetical protein